MAGREANAMGERAAPDAATLALAERIRAAAEGRRALALRGGDTKHFYGREVRGEPLDLAAVSGIVAFEPTELVITARAGTPLAEVEAALAARDQVLGFEPPRFGAASTIGGVVAAGLSGPARPYWGAARDFVLGVEMLDGRGQYLRFGGQVMKNVAGFDVSRLLAGSLGSLGVLVQVSLRVLPRPRVVRSLAWSLGADAARARMLALPRAPWPITGMCYDGALLRVRLAGSEAAVAHAVRELAPDGEETTLDFWDALRDLRLAFFAQDPRPLWRMSVPPTAPDPAGLGITLHDWGGAQRWVHVDDGAALRAHCREHGGHACRFRGGLHETPFAEPASGLRALMQRLKDALDPAGIFNPGRMYEWL